MPAPGAGSIEPMSPLRELSLKSILLLSAKEASGGGVHSRRVEKTGEHVMDVVAYWQKNCAPYLRAMLGRRGERGAALVEYALLLALIAVVCIVALTTLGSQAADKFSKVGASINSAG
jgi:pilus assembly protein Flp/PilA